MTKEQLENSLRDVKATLHDLDTEIGALRTEKSRKGSTRFLNNRIRNARTKRAEVAAEKKRLIKELSKIDPLAALAF